MLIVCSLCVTFPGHVVGTFSNRLRLLIYMRGAGRLSSCEMPADLGPCSEKLMACCRAPVSSWRQKSGFHAHRGFPCLLITSRLRMSTMIGAM
jgi:hypothetical protein